MSVRDEAEQRMRVVLEPGREARLQRLRRAGPRRLYEVAASLDEEAPAHSENGWQRRLAVLAQRFADEQTRA